MLDKNKTKLFLEINFNQQETRLPPKLTKSRILEHVT